MIHLKPASHYVALALCLAAGLAPMTAWATPTVRFDIHGPAGSGAFGTTVTALPNGNLVVTDPLYDAGGVQDVGAVFLYNGGNGALISTLTGSTALDRVGSGGVTVLSNGNYVVSSPHWQYNTYADAGAATWGSGVTGVGGTVTWLNSLIGTSTNDQVGFKVTALRNGHYVVGSPHWHYSTYADVGAATWGNGTSGTKGFVGLVNSLVGSAAGDLVGESVVPLTNGNYVVASMRWSNNGIDETGAATWGNGATGVKGPVTSANSLVGSSTWDWVGNPVVPLTNGNYVVGSFNWHSGGVSGVGAATWGNGASGISGAVSAANSLIGSQSGDYIGLGVVALTNGNYVVGGNQWSNGTEGNAGAITFGNGASGVIGVVSAAISLVGSHYYDSVGSTVTALANGNYTVNSSVWDNGGSIDAGSVTWGDGTIGVKGIVSAANSLVGNLANDRLGTVVTALSNGNYVVGSPYWNGQRGMATWCNGTTGTNGFASQANSLTGSQAGDRVGSTITALSNGSYVVGSPYWKNSALAEAGAATWGNGTSGISGTISILNSLIGGHSGDQVGATVTALNDGNYVVSSPNWDQLAKANVGAVTWGSGSGGIFGPILNTNSLVGSTANDRIGEGGVFPYGNGNYAVVSPNWDQGATADSGVITPVGPLGGYGSLNCTDSVCGNVAGQGGTLVQAFDVSRRHLVVGRPAENTVTILSFSGGVHYLPLIRR